MARFITSHRQDFTEVVAEGSAKRGADIWLRADLTYGISICLSVEEAESLHQRLGMAIADAKAMSVKPVTENAV